MSACFDTVNIIMKSRMRESRTYGSVRGLHCEVQVYSTREENSNGTVPTDYIYSDFNILNNIICDIHSQENKKALADIVFGRTSSAAYIHRTDDLL